MDVYYCVKTQLVASDVVQAEFLSDPMKIDEIRKEFDNKHIMPGTIWEIGINEGKQWNAKYVCTLMQP